MSKQYINQFIILMGYCILTACHDQPNSQSTELVAQNMIQLTADQKMQLGVVTQPINLDTIMSEIKIQGVVMIPPQRMQYVSLPVSAKIELLLIEPGQDVDKNQTLAILSDLSFIELQQDFLTTQLQEQQAEREWRRQEELFSKNATSDKAYQDSKNQWNLLQTQLQGLKQRLQLIGIPLPKDHESITQKIPLKAEQAGKITNCMVQPGQFISAGQQIAQIVNSQKLWVDAALYQLTDLKKITNNRVVLTDNDHHSCFGHILHEGNEISSSDQAAHLWIAVDDVNTDWLPGMPIQCQLQMNNVTAFVIPKIALVNFENQTFIFVTDNEIDFEMIPVQVVQEKESQVCIVPHPAISAKKIVTEGAYYLLMATKNKGE